MNNAHVLIPDGNCTVLFAACIKTIINSISSRLAHFLPIPSSYSARMFTFCIPTELIATAVLCWDQDVFTPWVTPIPKGRKFLSLEACNRY